MPVQSLTQHCCQHHQPRPHVQQRLEDLLTLKLPVLRSPLVISYSLQDRDTLFLCEHFRVYGRVREPNEDANSDDYSKSSQQDEDHAEWGEVFSVFERKSLNVWKIRFSGQRSDLL